MREIYGDLFGFNEKGPDCIAVTTNGFVDSAGRNVMGKGTAGEAKRRWPGIERILGRLIEKEGNHVHLLTNQDKGIVVMRDSGEHVPYHIVSFPTKPSVVHEASDLITHYRKANEGHTEDLNLPGWMAKSDLDLISQSAWELKELADRMGWQSMVIPRPGCANGQLSWDQVKPVLEEPFKDDRFFIITSR
jgi:hypothetical protein